ncbi:DUF1737 domain-containing protein [Pontibacter sp. BT310]|jgi:hypothetical protein|uniref:DUF1737 domain-containing protein n=1 Tax=Pontibacter populi TaxID=890055 RepID=A0ABS6XDC2_9BACT|nr:MULTISPECIES: DUF1737 domain-containing protein [Pontibacter]MBJ6119131.1 DUF1737 domain-containing protein [Pontibacter sp. BT310]MBR0571559.1 DUF1737 domain-containing protein [Microvirga sp. STS03]MBW3365985.1 DUF1737 domain-containing protein [Pontibacter populi]
MEYNIITAPDLDSLATKVADFFPMGWKLKGSILEHNDGFAQQLERRPSDALRMQRTKQRPSKQKRTKWIE